MSELKNDCGVTVGTFDGVHRGHQAVVDFLVKESNRRGLLPRVVTFDPHPLAVVNPDRAPLLLESLEDRVKRLRELGAEVEVIPFTEELRRTTVSGWLCSLKNEFGAKMLVAGYDNTFGSDGMEMNISDYRRLGAENGIETLVAPVVEGVSSTLIRKALKEGDVEEAGKMLGSPYRIEGIVEHGKELGRKIGFPTANLRISSQRLLPPPGVYAADALLEGGGTQRAVVNIGVAPTVGEGLPLTVEAHILGYTGDLYGCGMELALLKRLRPERKFDSIDSLTRQIAQDAQDAADFKKI